MLKIRLQRVGRKHDPSFRVVLVDSRRAAKSGSFLNVLGFYNARKKGELKLKGDKIKEWITRGAQVSDTVHNLLLREKIITGKKINVLPPKKKAKKEEQPKAAEPAKKAMEEKPAEAPTPKPKEKEVKDESKKVDKA